MRNKKLKFKKAFKYSFVGFTSLCATGYYMVSANILINELKNAEKTEVAVLETAINILDEYRNGVIAPLPTNVVENYYTSENLGIANYKNSFKTYMSYKAITNKTSRQWAMQQSAYTNEDGIRVYDGRYMVAVGTYYSKECGALLNVELDTGEILECIVGDIKQDKHTNTTNQYVPINGNVIEFIVDTSVINSKSKLMGDMSYTDGLEGNIVSIQKLEKINLE